MISEIETFESYDIEAIHFGILSEEEIVSASVKEIPRFVPIYDPYGFPMKDGLMDRHLGVLEPELRCLTCMQNLHNCMGHFGHHVLGVPVINPLFHKEIKMFLQVCCFNCGAFVLSENKLASIRERLNEVNENPYGKNRLFTSIIEAFIHDSKNKKICARCDSEHLGNTVKLTKGLQYEIQNRILTTSELQTFLRKVSDADLEILGIDPHLSRPENMILKVLPIPPINLRPTIILENSHRSEDDLTHKLVDIIKTDGRLEENYEGGSPRLIIDDLSNLLIYHVSTYLQNTGTFFPVSKHRNGKILKSVSQRFGGKEGRFRNSLSAKRVNFGARGVVTPNPYLKINEVSIPEEIALNMIIPICLTRDNLEYYQKLVREQNLESKDCSIPQIRYIIDRNNRKIKLNAKNQEFVSELLVAGDVVHRTLQEKDIVLFNRQPSLHKYSMMGHHVRFNKDKTFQFNPLDCTPYNADFDGDEMNIHFLQTIEAQVEAEELMMPSKNLLSIRHGLPLIAPLHDHITGLFLMSLHDQLVTERQMRHLLAPTSISSIDRLLERAVIDGDKRMFRTRDILSLVFPENFNYRHKTNASAVPRSLRRGLFKSIDNELIIKDGWITEGFLDSTIIGAEKSDLIKILLVDYQTSSELVTEMIENLSLIGLAYLNSYGLTVSLEDFHPSGEVQKMLNEERAKIRDEITRILRVPRADNNELVQERLNSYIERSTDLVLKDMPIDSSVITMALSGSRGSILNLSQISCLLGQQSVQGKPISRGYANRTLSCFRPGTEEPEVGGFIHGSYLRGLSPTEFYFHNIGGREGLIDTAVRTSISGYLERKMVFAAEDLKIDHRHTVKSCYGQLIQFEYGEDSISPEHSYRVHQVYRYHQVIDDLLAEHFIRRSTKKLPEIHELIEQISGFPIAAVFNPKVIRELAEHLIAERIEITNKSLTTILEQLNEIRKDKLIDLNEPIGVLTAQSIGEPGTQMNMRTFHTAGLKNLAVTYGLPRLVEIIDAKEVPTNPSMTIYLQPDIANSYDKAKLVAEALVRKTVLDFFDLTLKIEQLTIILVVKLAYQPEYEELLNLLQKQLFRALKVHLEIHPENYSVSIVFESYPELYMVLELVSTIIIRGSKQIQKILIDKQHGEYVLRSQGSDLRTILVHPSVDARRTTTNDIKEIERHYGIEAARYQIIKESYETLNEQGLIIDPRHLMLFADIMTNSGKVEGVGRYGISGYKNSILSKASFETSTQVLKKAAFFGETDYLRGVAENIIIGGTIPVGTGSYVLDYNDHFDQTQ